MPTTYNGIGTHYYGKKNVTTREAVCRHCHRTAKLKSYETRLWFVVVFVPIIPLGRRRIGDFCPLCTYHTAMPAHEWEIGRQVGTSSAIDQFRTDPSEESALAVHAQLIGFQQFDQAAAFRTKVLEQFPRGALLRTGLAGHLEHFGEYAQSRELLKESFEIDPDMPHTRVPLAGWKIVDKDLDGARELLRFLEAPGAHQQYDLNPVLNLALAFQQQKRHEEALELFQVFLRAYPKAGSHYQIRKFVATSEKALARPESILPPQQRSLKRLFSSDSSPGQKWAAGIAAVLLLAAIGLAINNEYIRRHRTLHVMNDTGLPANVQIDNDAPVVVGSGGTLTLAEGKHTIKVTGPVNENHEVTIDSGYFARWTHSPIWIVNVGGESVIGDMRIKYARNPIDPEIRLNADSFAAWPHIDFPFTQPPDQISTKQESGVIEKLHLTRLPATEQTSLMAFHLHKQRDWEQGLALAERRLQRNPNQPLLLEVYANACKDDEKGTRIRPLLESKLDVRPISVEWHRAYQDLPDHDAAALLARYDAIAAENPKDAAALYLRGRIEADPEKSQKYMIDAIAVNADVHWPYVGLALEAIFVGDWPAARKHLRDAAERGLSSIEETRLRHTIEVAAGEADQLAETYERQLHEFPADVNTAFMLAELEIMKAVDGSARFNRAVQARKDRQLQAEAINELRAYLEYMKGNMQGCIAGCKGEGAASLRATAILSDGRPDDAVNDPSLEPVWKEMPLALECEVAYRLQGNAEAAETWRMRAIEAMRRYPLQTSRVVEVLQANEYSDKLVETARRLPLMPMHKALLLVELGLRFPEGREKLFAEAETRLAGRRTPYHLIRKALDSSRQQP